MAQEQSGVKDRQHSSIRMPRKYTVFIHNDDFTTMEFVVLVLTSVFHKGMEEAERLMLQVHHAEKAPVGSYSYDIAMTKVARATEMARAEGFPLRLTIVGE